MNEFKLELRHLIGYPELRVISKETGIEYVVSGYSDINSDIPLVYLTRKGTETHCRRINEITPLLRPVSSLDAKFVFENIGDLHLNHESIEEIHRTPIGYLKHYQVLYLNNHHFDLWRLIEKGLALPIKY